MMEQWRGLPSAVLAVDDDGECGAGRGDRPWPKSKCSLLLQTTAEIGILKYGKVVKHKMILLVQLVARYPPLSHLSPHTTAARASHKYSDDMDISQVSRKKKFP